MYREVIELSTGTLAFSRSAENVLGYRTNAFSSLCFSAFFAHPWPKLNCQVPSTILSRVRDWEAKKMRKTASDTSKSSSYPPQEYPVSSVQSSVTARIEPITDLPRSVDWWADESSNSVDFFTAEPSLLQMYDASFFNYRFLILYRTLFCDFPRRLRGKLYHENLHYSIWPFSSCLQMYVFGEKLGQQWYFLENKNILSILFYIVNDWKLLTSVPTAKCQILHNVHIFSLTKI